MLFSRAVFALTSAFPAALVVGSVGVYQQWSAWIVWVSACSVAALAGWVSWRSHQTATELSTDEPSQGAWWVSGALVLFYVVLLATYALSRSDESLISPWQAVTPWCVPLFAMTSAITWLRIAKMPRWLAGVLTALQGLVAFGVSMVVYGFGYGFDPFIHQAAARSLVEHGFMALSSPLYVGYYTLLAGLHRLTTLSVDAIDSALVPLGMTAFLTWWTVEGTRLWRLPRWTGWLVLAIPYAFATFSVPYHLAIILLLWAIALLPRWEAGEGRLGIALLAIASVLIHPLTAVPLLMILVAGVVRSTIHDRYRLPLLALGTGVGVSALFWMYVTQGGGVWRLPSVESLRVGIRVLTGLPFFREPMPAWMWYVWNGQLMWMWIVLVIGAIGWMLLAPKEARKRGHEVIAITIGTALAALLVASSASFTNILPGEQYEFALRLRNLLPWLLFPGIGYAAAWLMSRRWLGYVGAFLVPCILTANWLASYPPNSPEMTMIAPGLGAAELRAFDAAELMSEHRPYAALAPRMVSAASLKRVGFERSLQTTAGERYPYAIPTGGELYALYLQLWTEREPQEVLHEACQFARVPQVIVVMPTAWDPNAWIDTRLTPLTTRWTTTDLQHRVYRHECK